MADFLYKLNTETQETELYFNGEIMNDVDSISIGMYPVRTYDGKLMSQKYLSYSKKCTDGSVVTYSYPMSVPGTDDCKPLSSKGYDLAAEIGKFATKLSASFKGMKTLLDGMKTKPSQLIEPRVEELATQHYINVMKTK